MGEFHTLGSNLGWKVRRVETEIVVRDASGRIKETRTIVTTTNPISRLLAKVAWFVALCKDEYGIAYEAEKKRQSEQK